jgi:hypothetical protein
MSYPAIEAEALTIDDDTAQVMERSLPSSLPMPSADNVRIFRVTPTVISVLDYSKGFGHTDLVTC